MLSQTVRKCVWLALNLAGTIVVITAPARGQQSMAMAMGGADPLGVSMDRMGSGTTWIPDAVSLPTRHYMAGQWDLMLHGFVFVQENVQGGPRGASQFGSVNWGM